MSLLTIEEGISEAISITSSLHLGTGDFDDRLVSHFIKISSTSTRKVSLCIYSLIQTRVLFVGSMPYASMPSVPLVRGPDHHQG